MAQSQVHPVITPAHAYDREPAPPPEREPATTGWVGWVIFGGIILFTAGSFNAIAGLIALFNSGYYLVPSTGLVVGVNYTAWGWTLLIYGALQALAGVGIMLGQTWARVVGVIMAVINAIVNLGFLGAYPIWSLIIIALDVVVIYALVVHGRETRSM